MAELPPGPGLAAALDGVDLVQVAPARRSDLDHTMDHARGGTTTRDDLGPA